MNNFTTILDNRNKSEILKQHRFIFKKPMKDYYGVHAKIRRMFPVKRPLFVSDDLGRTIITRSTMDPILNGIKNELAEEVNTLDLDTKLIQDNDQLKFHLKANPARSSFKKIIQAQTSSEVMEWIKIVQQRCGFNLIQLDDMYLEKTFVHKPGNSYSLVGASISGTLNVIDRDKFINMLSNGIGRGRSVGFGLMAIQRG